MFSPLWTRKKLIVWTDNLANAEAFYSSFCKNERVNNMIVCKYKIQVKKNFSIRLEHIAGKLNVEADLLSRGRHKEFLAKRPLARYLRPNIPNEYTNIISNIPSLTQ